MMYNVDHKYPPRRAWGLHIKSLVIIFKSLPYGGISVKKKVQVIIDNF